MQKIVNVRIDERLIHGQVAALWKGTLNATRIMVIDNEAVKNDLQKKLLKMACPTGTKLSILSTEKASENLSAEKYGDDRIFIIVKGPETILDLWKKGCRLEQVTVGNMSGGKNTRIIRKSVSIDKTDEDNFKLLSSYGVHFTAQMIPTEEAVDFMALL